jgi:hypothetical protein
MCAVVRRTFAPQFILTAASRIIASSTFAYRSEWSALHFRSTGIRNRERDGVLRSVAMAVVGHETEDV